MMEQRYSDNESSRRDIPSFIEPRPPLIQNPFMRPRPQKGVNLLEQFEEDSEIEEPELVQVYLRMKPCNEHSNLYEVRSDKCLVTSLDTTTAGHGRRTQHNVSRMYMFSRIFKSDCSQKEIFEQVVKDNLKKLPDGHNFTLLTYGASGSGKTYTLMGTVTSPGLVPRSLEYVFKLVDAAQRPTFKPSDTGADQLSYSRQDQELLWVNRLRQVSAPLREKYRRMSAQLCSDLTVSNIDLSNRTKHYVWVSFVEIYNEAIYDLLAPPDKRVKMRIREDSFGNVYVKGITHAFVRSGEEAYDVMVAGKHNLIVAATGIHAHSSRSHCIFTITMLTENEGVVRASHVRLCDLAGSERQRAARNTGARMQESRAINSSLHVLERCLHTLRRKQRRNHDSMVPYRESKLTRLLGSGLSGARGEAVSMVVTLNPSPRYAHETKHVLSLAAVAQDIQINNTMYASTLSTLESSTQDTTVCSSAEVMKLRADNERLHFELLQAQAHNKELLASMEETQQHTANTMRELVEETKDMMRQYYEAQIQALKTEMDDMIEEYESRLAKQAAPVTSAGTPSRYLQTKIAQLMTEITVLEDQLSEEKLARARAEKEVQHLRNCIEERDEKAFKETAPEKQENVVLTDSDHESDEDSDPLNESLEPVFKKECLNRSRILHEDRTEESLNPKTSEVETMDETIEENTVNEVEYESDKDKSNDTLKHDESVVKSKDSKDSLYATGDEESRIVENNQVESTRNSLTDFNQSVDDIHEKDVSDRVVQTDSSIMNDTIAEKDRSECEELFHESIKVLNDTIDEIKDVNPSNLTGTYFVKNEPREVYIEEKLKDKENRLVEEPEKYQNKVNNENVNTKNKQATKEVFKPKKISETLMSKITKSFKISQGSDSSLTQFELLEMASNDVNVSKDKTTDLVDIKILKEKRTYFDDAKEVSNLTEAVKNPTVVKKLVTGAEKNRENAKCLPLASIKEQENAKYLEAKSDDNINFSNSAKIQEKLLLHDSHKNTLETLNSNRKLEKAKNAENKGKEDNLCHLSSTAKMQEKRLFFDSHENILDSLPSAKKQQKAKYFEDEIDETKQSRLASKAKLQEKQIYFEESDKIDSNDVLISSSSIEKRTYFDNIDGNVDPVINKKLNAIIVHSIKDEERSPSIVKDDIITEKEYEPSIAVKKILGESFTKPELLSSIQKNKAFPKKHESVDIFESPQINLGNTNEAKDVAHKMTPEKARNNVESLVTQIKELSNLDVVRKTIERLVLEQKAKAEVKQEIKLETALSVDEPVAEEYQKSEIGPKQSIEKDTVSLKKEFNDTNSKENNTIDEFENICKDLTDVRATEFELLISQDVNTSDAKDKTNEEKSDTTIKEKHDAEISDRTRKFEETKYNLRNKEKLTNLNVTGDKKGQELEEILAESHSKCESTKTITKRSLRLRRRNNQEENHNQENDSKFKNILNLKKEFSDVTMGVPVMKKEVKDIPSPEKQPGEEENLPPMMGIQSCPSKSVTRSRRKLFTPRAEPLEESLSQTGDSNERLCVPRPSYHRGRARRKL